MKLKFIVGTRGSFFAFTCICNQLNLYVPSELKTLYDYKDWHQHNLIMKSSALSLCSDNSATDCICHKNCSKNIAEEMKTHVIGAELTEKMEMS